MESFFHSDVEGTPAGRQRANDLVGQHPPQGMGSRSCFEASEDRTHCEVHGFAGTKRSLDSRQSFGAIVDHLLVCLRGRQVGVEHRAPIEFGCFLLHPGSDRQRYGALLSGPLDPVSEA
jgi:hypothetical protein